jgi:predicted acyltransferase
MARDPVRDAVRGLTSLEMTFVNISELAWTAHSPFVGQVTYADTIFPCFAFLSGMSWAPSRRNVGLIGVGLGLNALGAAVSGKSSVRIPGVLQRLGLASLIANEPSLAFLRQYHGAPLVLLWYVITLLGSASADAYNPLAHPDFPASDATGTAQTRIDTTLVGQRLYRPSFDPEGLLGSLTTAVSMLLGRAFVELPLPVSHHLVAAAGMITVGEAAHFMLPKYAAISKSLWTPSFVLVSSGLSILKYVAVERGLRYLPSAIQDTLQAVGRRPLEVYIISTLLIMVANYGESQSLMARGKRLLSRFVGLPTADFVLSSGITGLVAAAAQFLVSRNIRLRW